LQCCVLCFWSLWSSSECPEDDVVVLDLGDLIENSMMDEPRRPVRASFGMDVIVACPYGETTHVDTRTNFVNSWKITTPNRVLAV
jgi:hypothetical protein